MLVTFEGIDGSGKTSVIDAVCKKLTCPYVRTKEPGGTPLGKKIREVVKSDIAMCPLAEYMLFWTDRAQHIEQVIKPALAQGKLVISDRFYDSTKAYQKKVPEGLPVFEGIMPDHTFLLDLPVEVAVARRTGTDKYDGDLDRVRKNYLELAKNGSRWHILDATKSQPLILGEIMRLLGF